MLVRDNSLILGIAVVCLLTLPLLGDSTMLVDEATGDASANFLGPGWTERIAASDGATPGSEEFLYKLCLDIADSDSAGAVVQPDWFADLENTDDAASFLLDGVTVGNVEHAHLPFAISDLGKLLPGDDNAIAPSLQDIDDDTDGAEVEVTDSDNPTAKPLLFVLLATAVLMGLGNGGKIVFRRHKATEADAGRLYYRQKMLVRSRL